MSMDKHGTCEDLKWNLRHEMGVRIGFKESLYRVLNLRTCEGILVIRCVVVKIATPQNFSRTWEIDNKERATFRRW